MSCSRKNPKMTVTLKREFVSEFIANHPEEAAIIRKLVAAKREEDKSAIRAILNDLELLYYTLLDENEH